MAEAIGTPPSADSDARAHRRRRALEEARRVLALALPISASEVISFGGYLITTAQVGHLGSVQLSAITLARSVFHVTGLSLVVGMASAVGTFCGQAHGAEHFGVLGVVLQRATLLSLLTCVLPLALWTHADWLIGLFGQTDPTVIGLSASYLKMLWPALLCWAVTNCIHGYLSSQGVVTPLTVVAAACAALTPLVNHVCIFRLGMGMLGAAMAYNVLQALELLAMIVTMAWLHVFRQRRGTHTWRGFSRRALDGWGAYLRVALPSAAAICIDWWTYEAVVIMAGALPDAHVQLGAMGLAFNTHALLFMLVGGFSSAASTRVSNELGAGRGDAAHFAARVTLVLGVAAPLAASAGLLSAPRSWAGLYTNDGDIISLVARVMPLLSLSNISDSAVSVINGVLTGAGRQELAFKVNLAAYGVVGLPGAFLLGLHYGLGARGMWFAMAAASLLQALILGGALLRFNWGSEARKAQERVASSEGAAVAAADEAEQERLLLADDVPEAGETTGNGEHAGGAHKRPAGGVHANGLHGGMDSRRGVHEPLLGTEHVL